MSAEEEFRSFRRHAETVKSVHKRLRDQCHGDDERVSTVVWKRHLGDQEGLKRYARSMEIMANEHWTKNKKNASRTEWVERAVKRYFVDEDWRRIIRRSRRRAHLQDNGVSLQKKDKYAVLDVGSCYNPFANCPFMGVTAVDISPVEGDNGVLKCDFVDVDIGQELVIDQDNSTVKCLPASSFDAVVFCFLLEYLPTPKMRYGVVKKAISVLRSYGILVIVTPDSGHKEKNLDVMRSWKACLGTLNACRVYYEKETHFHGMAFVKLDSEYQNLCCQDVDKDLSKLGKRLGDIDISKKLMVIPQDKETDNEESC